MSDPFDPTLPWSPTHVEPDVPTPDGLMPGQVVGLVDALRDEDIPVQGEVVKTRRLMRGKRPKASS